jgi:hypothetical protein
MKTFIEFLTERKPLGISARKKMARRMAKMMKSPTMQKKIAKAKLKRAGPDKLLAKAQKAAKMAIIKKAGIKDYNTMSPMKKIAVDKHLAKKYAAIPKIAKKMVLKIKKAETERIVAARKKKSEE